jgi:hypothetical protein
LPAVLRAWMAPWNLRPWTVKGALEALAFHGDDDGPLTVVGGDQPRRVRAGARLTARQRARAASPVIRHTGLRSVVCRRDVYIVPA